MKNTQYTIPLLALIMFMPASMSNSYTQETLGQLEKDTTPYTFEEIEHSFDVMEEYVIYDENKNITFNITNAVADNISQNDIDIVLDFAVHSNDIMNTAIGPTGKVDELSKDNDALRQAIQELQDDKFQALFGEEISHVGSVDETSFTSYQ